MEENGRKVSLLGTFLLVLGAMFAFHFWTLLAGVVWELGGAWWPETVKSNAILPLFISELGAVGVACLFLAVLGYWRKARDFKQIKLGRGIFLGLPVLLWATFLAALSVLAHLYGETEAPFASGGTVVLFGLYIACIGIFEEFVFRGILLEGCLDFFADSKIGIILAAVLSSLIFGAFHLINVLAGASFSATFSQMFYASITGFFLAALYIRTKNIWVCVFYHAFWDACLALGLLWGDTDLVNTEAVGWSEALASLIFVLPSLITALYLLLKKDKAAEH